MSEPIVDEGTRAAVLGALAERSKQKATPEAASSNDDVDEKTPFSELLERTLAKREEVDKESIEASDEVRKKAISESKVDIVGDIMKRLL